MSRHLPVLDFVRPKTRGDCAQVPRPCPFVSCHHHLFLDVDRSGNIKHNFPGLEPHEMKHSCVLDVVDAQQEAETTLDVVGAHLGVTRERARQIEAECIDKLVRMVGPNGFAQLIPGAALPAVERPLPHQRENPLAVDLAPLSRAEARRLYLLRQQANAAFDVVAVGRVGSRDPTPFPLLAPLVLLRRAHLVHLARFLKAA